MKFLSEFPYYIVRFKPFLLDYHDEKTYRFPYYIVRFKLKRNSGDGNVHIDKININIGYVDNTGYFNSANNADATITFSTASTTYVELCLQDFVGIASNYPLTGKRFAVKVNIFAHVDSGTTGQLGIYHARGSADSYVEVELL